MSAWIGGVGAGSKEEDTVFRESIALRRACAGGHETEYIEVTSKPKMTKVQVVGNPNPRPVRTLFVARARLRTRASVL
jgi:hypothetical protein